MCVAVICQPNAVRVSALAAAKPGLDALVDRQFQATNAGYAIPIDHALDIANRIEAGQSSSGIQIGRPAFLGVEIVAPSQADSSFGGYSAPSDRGAVVANVEPGLARVGAADRTSRSTTVLPRARDGDGSPTVMARAWTVGRVPATRRTRWIVSATCCRVSRTGRTPRPTVTTGLVGPSPRPYVGGCHGGRWPGWPAICT